MNKSNYFILTGAMGAGKSTILSQLKMQFSIVPEPAREILAEQRAIGGEGVPELSPKLFTELMLSRAIHQYNLWVDSKKPVIFDRGIADNHAYADLFDLDIRATINAAKRYRYNSLVFFLPAWEDIYSTDDERKMSFAAASKFGDSVKALYESLGYNLVDVPLVGIKERVEFITDKINEVI